MDVDICVYFDYGSDDSVWVRYHHSLDSQNNHSALLLVNKHIPGRGYYCEPLIDVPNAELVKNSSFSIFFFENQRFFFISFFVFSVDNEFDSRLVNGEIGPRAAKRLRTDKD